jgi:hypothetical protein
VETPTIETRIALLEKEIAELKRRLGQDQDKSLWLEAVLGSMEGCPDFPRVVDFGRKSRESYDSSRCPESP